MSKPLTSKNEAHSIGLNDLLTVIQTKIMVCSETTLIIQASHTIREINGLYPG